MRPIRSTRGHVRVLLASILLVVLLALLVGPTSGVASDGVENVTLYRASDTAFESAETVESGIANGSIEPADSLVVGDALVVVIESDRLAETMAAGNGSTTERFFDALDGDAAFHVVQTNPTPQASRKVASIGRENVTVHRNGTRTYVLVDTGDLEFRYRRSEVRDSARIFGGERFAVDFGYSLANLSAPGYEPAGPVVELFPFKSQFDTTGRSYEPLPPQWVGLSVHVNIPPEESLVVRLTLDGNRTITAPVEPEDVPGQKRVWFDLGGVDPGTQYVLELVHDGEVVDRYTGTVREPSARVTDATLTQLGSGTAVNVTVRLSHGGKVQVFDEECNTLGTKWVEPGVETRLSIELWNQEGERIRVEPGSEYGFLVRSVRHRGAGEVLYNGPSAEATLDFDGSCRTPTPRPTPTETTTEQSPRTPTPSTTHEQDDATGSGDDRGGDGRTDTPGQPGFTVLTLLVALLVAALLRARRR